MGNMLTVKQVAERLQVSVQTVRRLVGSGELPHHRVGRVIRIKESDLQEFIDKGKGSALACASQTNYTPDTAHA